VRLLRRGRVLVAQATSRLLLDELGLALAKPAGRAADARMARLVDQLRVRTGRTTTTTTTTTRKPRRTGGLSRQEPTAGPRRPGEPPIDTLRS
jgi:hypothetical protein